MSGKYNIQLIWYIFIHGNCAVALTGQLIIAYNTNRAMPYPSAQALSGQERNSYFLPISNKFNFSYSSTSRHKRRR